VSLSSNLLKVHFNIILPSTRWLSQRSLSYTFPPPKPCMQLSCPPYVLHVPPNHDAVHCAVPSSARTSERCDISGYHSSDFAGHSLLAYDAV
jgi:hypothetical protein